MEVLTPPDQKLIDATRSMHYFTGVTVSEPDLNSALNSPGYPYNLDNIAQASIIGLAYSPICPEAERSWRTYLTDVNFSKEVYGRSILVRPAVQLSSTTGFNFVNTYDANNQPIIPNPISSNDVKELPYIIPVIFKPTQILGYDYSEPTGVGFIPGLGLTILSPVELGRYNLADGSFFPELDVERFEESPEEREPVAPVPNVYFNRLFRFWHRLHKNTAVEILDNISELSTQYSHFLDASYIGKIQAFRESITKGEFDVLSKIN